MLPKYSPDVYVFVGPSLYGYKHLIQKNSDQKIHWLNPVKRDDIKNLIENNDPSTIIIADGNFHNCLSVGHKEIRDGIALKWSVWGVSSMGAIRAAEMKTLGMKGYGFVYNLFANDPTLRDDEVALLHSIEDPYLPLSEPLINIRYALSQLQNNVTISKKDSQTIIDLLKQDWYGDRTLNRLSKLLKEKKSLDASFNIESFIKNFSQFRIKSIDFINLFNSQEWKN
jgi:hypothetical protein